MLVFDVAYTDGLSRSRDGRSDLKPLADAIARAAPADAPVWSVHPDDPARAAPLDLSIYLNRVVRPAASAAGATAPGRQGQVIVLGSRRGDVVPSLPAPGAAYLGAARRGDVTWHAFVVGPAGVSPGGTAE
jgi:hypothetical protein